MGGNPRSADAPVIIRESGWSGTPRPVGSSTAISGILDGRFRGHDDV